MRSIYRHYGTVILLAIAAAALSSGCVSASDPSEVGSDSESTGSLRVPIVTPTGATFRLRHGTFDVTGPAGSTLTLDSEAAPDASELKVDLNQGTYTIRLKDGWSIEKLGDGGTFTEVRAALVSPNPTTFEIKHQHSTDLTYSFGTDTGVVTFGRGSLSVGIAVSTPATSTNCYLLLQPCPNGQSCLLLDDTGQTFCAEAGTLPVGSPCTSERCVLGAQCLKLDSEHPDQGVCATFCSTGFPPIGCDCRGLSFSSDIGVCQNPVLGACDPVAQSGCAAGEACQSDGGSSGTCGTPGSAQAGFSCSGDASCAAGLDCQEGPADGGPPSTCWKFCDTRLYGSCGYVFGSNYAGPTSCRATGRGFLGLCMP